MVCILDTAVSLFWLVFPTPESLEFFVAYLFHSGLAYPDPVILAASVVCEFHFGLADLRSWNCGMYSL